MIMENVSYIIPLNEYNKEIEKRLKKALNSLDDVDGNEDDEILFVGPQKVIEKAASLLSKKNHKEVTLVANEEKTDFFNQVNTAVFSCTTPFFSILEFDDAYKPYWNTEAQRYGTAVNASIILPLNEFTIDGEFSSLGNEIVWSSVFAEKENETLGFISIDTLDTFFDFNITGALIRTEDFISLGGLKPSLKIAAWYEFLLRAAYNKKVIYVVPKVGYEHTVQRKGSYTDTAYKTISAEEGKWLIATAKQEYFFKEDRNKIFEQETSEAEK